MNTSSTFNYWGLHFLTLPISSYVTEGVAKICGFEVLRHGTSFPQYIGILRDGGIPAYGSKTTTEFAFDDITNKQAMACRNRFYVFKDSEAYLDDKRANIRIPIVGHIIKRTYPRVHAAVAGTYFAKNTENTIVRICQKILYGSISLFCPAIRFVYKNEEMQKFNSEQDYNKFKCQTKALPLKANFIDDEDYGKLAYKTPDILPNDRIGLIGLYTHAKWSDVKKTVQTKPGQVLLGTIQLIIGISLTIRGYGILL